MRAWPRLVVSPSPGSRWLAYCPLRSIALLGGPPSPLHINPDCAATATKSRYIHTHSHNPTFTHPDIQTSRYNGGLLILHLRPAQCVPSADISSTVMLMQYSRVHLLQEMGPTTNVQGRPPAIWHQCNEQWRCDYWWAETALHRG